MKNFSMLTACLLVFSVATAQEFEQIGTDTRTVTHAVNLGGSNPTPSSSYFLSWVRPNPDRDGVNFNSIDPFFYIELNALGSATAKPSDFEVLVNGHRIGEDGKSDSGSIAGTTFSINVPLAIGKNEIEVRWKTVRTKTITVNFTPTMPNLYILAIAPATPAPLKYNQKDAADIIAMFKSQADLPLEKRLFGKVSAELVDGNTATAAFIGSKIARLERNFPTKKDVVLIFISTHGLADGVKLRLQASDFDALTPELTSISFQRDIVDKIKNMDCKRIIIMDACQSGNFLADRIAAKATVQEIQLARKDYWNLPNDITIISSSSDEELSWENEVWQNGALTKALKNGLQNGEADGKSTDTRKGIITLNELFAYLEKSVPEMVQQKGFKDPRTQRTATQNPKCKNLIGDLPIFILNR